jgi:hypothetical protein
MSARIPKTNADAKKAAREWLDAVAAVEEFNQEVAKLAKKKGIDQIRAEIPVLNQRVLRYMQEEGMRRLDLGDDGYVNFIQATGEHVWISTTADIPKDAPASAKSLRKILGKDLWTKVTRRVVDPKKIEQLIDEGEITEKQVAAAHFTRKRAPYIRHERGPSGE